MVKGVKMSTNIIPFPKANCQRVALSKPPHQTKAPACGPYFDELVQEMMSMLLAAKKQLVDDLKKLA